MHISFVQDLTHLLDYTMSGIKKILKGWNESSRKDKLGDFVNEFWHYYNITKLTEEEFTKKYLEWAKENKYHQSMNKAHSIYSIALKSISKLPTNAKSVKMLVKEAVRLLKEVNITLNNILSRMKELVKTLPEYPVVRAMSGVGDVLAPKLIAEIGDVRRFHNGKALVAYAGIDAQPYQSGQFLANNRKISKRGPSVLRKIG